MTVYKLPAQEALRRLGEFDAIIDARSEGEFELDHLPHAVNWPVLNNEERAIVVIVDQFDPEASGRPATIVVSTDGEYQLRGTIPANRVIVGR